MPVLEEADASDVAGTGTAGEGSASDEPDAARGGSAADDEPAIQDDEPAIENGDQSS
jgi:hypothetical protein